MKTLPLFVGCSCAAFWIMTFLIFNNCNAFTMCGLTSAPIIIWPLYNKSTTCFNTKLDTSDNGTVENEQNKDKDTFERKSLFIEWGEIIWTAKSLEKSIIIHPGKTKISQITYKKRKNHIFHRKLKINSNRHFNHMKKNKRYQNTHCMIRSWFWIRECIHWDKPKTCTQRTYE